MSNRGPKLWAIDRLRDDAEFEAIHTMSAAVKQHQLGIVALCDEVVDLRKAARAILAEPYGCVFCDSGKLRNPDKPHEDDCGFALAIAALGGMR